jgi:hypothetical protein
MFTGAWPLGPLRRPCVPQTGVAQGWERAHGRTKVSDAASREVARLGSRVIVILQ